MLDGAGSSKLSSSLTVALVEASIWHYFAGTFFIISSVSQMNICLCLRNSFGGIVKYGSC